MKAKETIKFLGHESSSRDLFPWYYLKQATTRSLFLCYHAVQSSVTCSVHKYELSCVWSILNVKVLKAAINCISHPFPAHLKSQQALCRPSFIWAIAYPLPALCGALVLSGPRALERFVSYTACDSCWMWWILFYSSAHFLTLEVWFCGLNYCNCWFLYEILA